MRKIIFVVAATALTVSLSVDALQAQSQGNGVRYRWRDGSGLPHYSDSLTSDAMKYGYEVVNDRGLVIRHVERQLNPQERAAAQKLADEQAAQKLAAQEQARSEMQMLTAYPDEDSYKSSLKLEMNNIDQQISTTRINLHSQEKALADLLARAADAERAKQTVPKFLSDSITKQRNVVAGQRNTLEHQLSIHDAADQKAKQQLQRYRELKAAQAQGQTQS
ncbi:DUF4124 domain-containing protein [Dyella tabacisoli]|uniref:DUF4124 domain-containing protein n=1 Tax=Dyella tabacisoli TaxID=2282381 RepID=A0A369UMS0_9GAMM|nr:DUF4124 domain-containing protein [Dyella tabacisoli]RDD81018.1 DUF4124 domain-containing protein [Dyella tabacisoli]